MKTITRTFKPQRSTPGTHVFAEQPPAGEAPIINQLYLQKHIVEQPGEMTITVGETAASDLPDGARIDFLLEKATKNTIRYQEVERPGHPLAIKSLYLQKWFAGAAPQITLVIHA